MEYKTEFETRNDVKKMFVANGKALYFVPDGTGKYEFCNESPPAYAGGIIIGQAPLVQNLRALDTLYSVVSLPR